MSLRWRIHRLLHWRFYRREARMGRFYFEYHGRPLRISDAFDRTNEVRSHDA